MNTLIRFATTACAVAIAIAILSSTAAAAYVSSNLLFPAPMYSSTNPVEYVTPAGTYRAGRGHDFFDIFTEPPPGVALPVSPGVVQVNSFFDVFAEFDFDLLLSPPPVAHHHAPAPMSTSVMRLNGLPPGDPVFATEILQLDISGGTLPGGIMVRESPTRASLGRHALTELGGGLYLIDSFFDVFTELSIDGGQTWTPGSSPFHLVGGPIVPEPTSAALLIIGVTMWAWRRQRSA
jgi:hypothetical protein